MIYIFLNNTYFFFIIFIVFFIFLSAIVFLILYFLSDSDNSFEKISAYECGFEPFEDTRIKFDVRFYLVGLLFLVFDIELMFLFPWVLCFQTIILLPFGFFSMFIFFIVLTLGFIYEWQYGALDWS